MRWYYLSFSGDEGWRGGLHVRVAGVKEAHRTANLQGNNPGGEVLIVPCPDGWEPPEAVRNRLITSRAELEKHVGPTLSTKELSAGEL